MVLIQALKISSCLFSSGGQKNYQKPQQNVLRLKKISIWIQQFGYICGKDEPSRNFHTVLVTAC